ncbi:hypothetical protein B0H34DRAFT_283047 [Crassisporium funariophilum]|nr:hypothetical protein B0H34DRAFT_283047 [Crassisporium funariophilum]
MLIFMLAHHQRPSHASSRWTLLPSTHEHDIRVSFLCFFCLSFTDRFLLLSFLDQVIDTYLCIIYHLFMPCLTIHSWNWLTVTLLTNRVRDNLNQYLLLSHSSLLSPTFLLCLFIAAYCGYIASVLRGSFCIIL